MDDVASIRNDFAASVKIGSDQTRSVEYYKLLFFSRDVAKKKSENCDLGTDFSDAASTRFEAKTAFASEFFRDGTACSAKR